jgi:integrase
VQHTVPYLVEPIETGAPSALLQRLQLRRRFQHKRRHGPRVPPRMRQRETPRRGSVKVVDCELIFPTPRGRMWRERNFYRDVWKPSQEASGLDVRPHECRHSYVTHLRSAGVNDADLAEIAGHRVETMLARYVHGTGESFPAARQAIG